MITLPIYGPWLPYCMISLGRGVVWGRVRKMVVLESMQRRQYIRLMVVLERQLHSVDPCLEILLEIG